METPTGAAVVRNVDQRTVVGGVAGSGANVSGANLPVARGFAGSPQSASAVVVTVPVNAEFFVTDMAMALSRFWVVPIETEDGVA